MTGRRTVTYRGAAKLPGKVIIPLSFVLDAETGIWLEDDFRKCQQINYGPVDESLFKRL